MTGIHFTRPAIHPPPEPDPLGTALLSALQRDLGRNLSWAWPVILIGGIATAGLLPLVVLLLRFRTFATTENFHFEHVTEWAESRGLAGDRLESATRELGTGWRGLTLVGLVLWLAALGMAMAQVAIERFSGTSLLSLLTIYSTAGLSAVYMLLLILAYGVCLQFSVSRYVRAVTNYLAALQEVTDAPRGEASITPPAAKVGWIWTATGVLLLAGGCLWGLPMMLAAGAHRRYISGMSGRVRERIAGRIAATMRRDPTGVSA